MTNPKPEPSELGCPPFYSVVLMDLGYWLCENMQDWQGMWVRRPVFELDPHFHPYPLTELAAAEKLALDWCHAAGWATGHGDTLRDILSEMRSQHCDERSELDEARAQLAREAKMSETMTAEVERLKRELVAADSWYDELKRDYDALREAAEELLEVADLRGDTQLPHPEDDPTLWTARMQTAWDEFRAALERD